MTSAEQPGPQQSGPEPTGTPTGSAARAPEGSSAEPAAARPDTGHRHRPSSPAFRKFIASGWEPRPGELPAPLESVPYAAARREALSARFPGDRLVVPAGVLRVRSNDTDYRFRPHSAFSHLTGTGADQDPDAVLVLQPDGHAELYARPRAERDTEEFYADARYGELWVGPRPTLAEVAARTGLDCRHLDELKDAVVDGIGGADHGTVVRIVPGADPKVEEWLAEARRTAELDLEKAAALDGDLAQAVSELRLVKDAWEIEQLRRACDVTAAGFADIVRALPDAIGSARGERVVEAAFESRARREGNGVGYDTIAAAGPHACTLHWIRNDGPVRDGDLVLVDAGAEVDSLYTADVTRTLPVNGRFTEPQRRVYQAVLDAADAAFAAARPGAKFRDVHKAAMLVIAQRMHDWGLLPGTAEESLSDEGQFHRRWMVHGTSHHLGLDVHDCAKARRELYLDGVLEPGMVFTIEPGLYFMPDDLLVPEELRGIGVRIEDDVLLTADGCENLSAALPRDPDAVEAWFASLRD